MRNIAWFIVGAFAAVAVVFAMLAIAVLAS